MSIGRLKRAGGQVLRRLGLLSSPTPADPSARLGVAPVAFDAAGRDAMLDVLVAAYPDFLSGHEGDLLHWREGPPSEIGASVAAEGPAALLERGSILDMFAWNYPLASAALVPPASDPGRVRCEAFFTRMYGDCAAGDVEPVLVTARWTNGHMIRATRVNGVAAALERVARALEALGPPFARYPWPTGGVYRCRSVAGTARRSMHGYGAAIDLNPDHGDYWQWADAKRHAIAPWRNRLPVEIVRAFERQGFIWGGRWAHFDTMHFEYRPELIAWTKLLAQPLDT